MIQKEAWWPSSRVSEADIDIDPAAHDRLGPGIVVPFTPISTTRRLARPCVAARKRSELRPLP
jgi:hypothetical protein